MDLVNRQYRNGDRLAVCITCLCRSDRGAVGEIVVVDLSQFGCGTETKGFPLRMHQHVLLRIAGLEALPATVCWIRGLKAGFEFDRPLHFAVVNHLYDHHPPSVHAGMTDTSGVRLRARSSEDPRRLPARSRWKED